MELKQQRRRRERKLHLKCALALFQTSSLLFHLVHFFNCLRTFLELNSKGLFVSLEKEKENRRLASVHVVHKINVKLLTSKLCSAAKEMYKKA